LIGVNGAATLTKRIYALGNFSRFIRPGWVRVKTTGSVNGLLVSAYKNPAGGDFAIVVINAKGHAVSASFGVAGPAFASVSPYVTSGTPIGSIGTDGNLSQGSGNLSASIPASANAFAVTIPSGITTFVGSAP
jgi:glucuronoarabinoxylan endo-1,4-beta-xylanase